MLISEITGSGLHYPVPHNNKTMSCLFLSLPTYLLNIMVSTTQTLSQIKSEEFIGHIQKHFITTSPLTYVTNGIRDLVKCCIKRWVPFDPATCCLVDYNLLGHPIDSVHCQCILTVRHILMECNHFGQAREDIFGRRDVLELFRFRPTLIL